MRDAVVMSRDTAVNSCAWIVASMKPRLNYPVEMGGWLVVSEHVIKVTVHGREWGQVIAVVSRAKDRRLS